MGISAKNRKQQRYIETKSLNAMLYIATDKEKEAYEYCVKNNIRISPIPTGPGTMPEEWYIGISTPDNYKKVYKSKFKYNHEQIWPAFYEACCYYYGKK